jgi:hypothetical protein
MRRISIAASVALVCLLTTAGQARAEGLLGLAGLGGGGCDCGCEQEACNSCGECGGRGGLFGHHGGGHHGGGHCGGGHCGHGHHQHLEGLDRHFNCGCNGSYKFPVPPLYTYHWPGMNSAQLMTDYHSPYRFPPIKPYVDEVPVDGAVDDGSLRRLRPAQAQSVLRSNSLR